MVRLCVSRDCFNLAHRGFRKCMPCIRPKEEEE